MYSILSQFSSFVSKPFINMAYSLESWPIVFAFILGLIGALAPCQLTGNISAVTFMVIVLFKRKLLGRTYSFYFRESSSIFFIRILVWLLGREFEQSLTLYFPWLRKIMGPVLVIVGLFMLGFIKLKGTINLFKGAKEYKSENPLVLLCLGFSFSLAFCPTMFILFFVTLMPVVLSSPMGSYYLHYSPSEPLFHY